MSVSVRDAAALWDMVQAAKKIQQFTAEISKSQYFQDDLVQSAVERKFEILGEAARRISAEFRAEHPEIDWQGVIGFRNVIAHQYDHIDQDQIWRIARTILPDYLEILESLLPPIED